MHPRSFPPSQGDSIRLRSPLSLLLELICPPTPKSLGPTEGSISPEASAESVLMRPGALEGPAARYAPGVSAVSTWQLQAHA